MPTLPPDIVDLIVDSIATQEGELDSHARNNPGNLRYAGQHGASRPDGYVGPVRAVEPVAQFDTWEDGVIALYRQVWAQIATGETLRQVITQFAPPNENATVTYVANVEAWSHLPLDTPVRSILQPLVKMTS